MRAPTQQQPHSSTSAVCMELEPPQTSASSARAAWGAPQSCRHRKVPSHTHIKLANILLQLDLAAGEVLPRSAPQ